MKNKGFLEKPYQQPVAENSRKRNPANAELQYRGTLWSTKPHQLC